MATRSTMGSRDLAAEPPESDAELAVLERNGITRIVTHRYEVDGYRYTSLADALAQVARHRRAAG